MRRGALLAVLAALVLAAPAHAADPLFEYEPQPPSPSAQPEFPPDGYLDGPCGLAVDSAGRFYVADHYHRAVDVFDAAAPSRHEYLTQLAGLDPADGPCGLALDASNRLYVNDYHGGVQSFGPEPSFTPGPAFAGVATATGVAVEQSTGRVYVDQRTYVGVYEPSGAPLEEEGEPLRIGAATLGDGYGIAVSAYPGTEGFLYVPDAASDTVKVYDPATDAVESIAGPPGGFVSLRDSAVAVDRLSGEVYVLDDLQPGGASLPRALVDVFDSSGAYQGHLEREVVDGEPSGLAVDNSAGPTQGRVYVTSGNTLPAGVYAYARGAATTNAPLAPSIPRPPLDGEQLLPTVPIGGPVPGGSGTRIECEGDACQALPSEPTDPTLDTLIPGPGNPKVRYRRHGRRHRAHRHHHRSHRRHRGGRRHRKGARASSAAPAAGRRGAAARSGSLAAPAAVMSASAPGAASAGLLPGEEGFSAHLIAAGGEAATLAGSHPYRLDFDLGLDQGSGEADLRGLRIDLPPGLLADPAASQLCGAARFAATRSSPFETSASGESCPAGSQVGTVEVRTGLGPRRSFGLFELEPPTGAALRLGASPYGVPLLLDGRIDEEGGGGAHLNLEAAGVPAGLRLQGLALSLWGAPWDASHNAERGDCLDEAMPAFPWCKSSVGEPLDIPPLAFLTLPTACAPALPFAAAIASWQDPAPESRQAPGRDAEGDPAPLVDCAGLRFSPRPEGLLTTRKASSSSGFVFRLAEQDPGLADPRARIRALPRGVGVRLPAGVTLNPSMGAGLGVCTPAQYASESAEGAEGTGCPNTAKIGDFSVRSPFYEGFLKGAVYLAAPHDNPFGSLLALYLVAKAADRGIVVKAAGKIEADPSSGDLSATFDELPQLPYSELEVNLRSGQRAPLVTPDACGPATTRMQMTPWAQGAPSASLATDSPIETGIEAGPCPSGATPPFQPGVLAGGVNSNVNSYTPYFVHLIRKDTEQEITSYSLTLPEGITGKLAGIPFCPDAAIAAARANSGAAETANPSCPTASQVGRTESGYGVGSALTYAPGRIYLAGPYHGAPLSLVTVNPATVGPFDLGTIVVRSAFGVDPRSAQLQIDSRASDRIPHIIDGIPLHLRDVRVYMDRPEFTHNPSSCEASQLVSTLTGAGARLDDASDDSSATVTERFQLLNCLTLGFRPKLGLRLRGPARRGGFPALRATFASRGARDSNLKRIEVDMPHQLFLAQNHIRGVCTRPEFDAERCPPSSIYGQAVAYTPLLDEPLRGKVYLRSSSHKLPDLVTDLRSGSIRIVLEGRIGPTKRGGIQAFFDDLPDAPIERFTMLLRGGKHGLLTNSVNVCARPPVAAVKALGQNDKGSVFSSKLRGQCHGKKKHKGKKGKPPRGHAMRGGGR